MHEVMIHIMDTEVDTIIGKVYRIVTTAVLEELKKIHGDNIVIIKGVLG